MIVISVNADKYKNSYLFISVTPFGGREPSLANRLKTTYHKIFIFATCFGLLFLNMGEKNWTYYL